MKDTFEMKIGPDGTVETIYQDGIEAFAESVGAEISTVCRASDVEWEEVASPINARFPATKGWSVRAAHRPALALRMKSHALMGNGYMDELVCSDHEHLAIALFDTREDAITQEIKFFWKLLERDHERQQGND